MRWVLSSKGVRAAIAAVLVVCAGITVSACSATQDDADVDVVAGKRLFAERCGSCHVLGRAGTRGVTGPNLDEAFQQALKDGLGRSGIRGAVRSQINAPSIGSGMPADLVKGEQADQVAAYVAQSVARSGEDTGLLATAVPKAGGGEPAVAKGGTLDIPADPGGQLAYVTKEASAKPGALNVRSENESGTPHNIVIDGKGKGEVVQDGGVSEFEADFTAGDFEYYCSVPGHREAGMEGKLTVE
jgi:mono/diheme cytochrome c family protein